MVTATTHDVMSEKHMVRAKSFDTWPMMPGTNMNGRNTTTVVRTDEGVIVFTHLWWMAEGPPEDPLADDPAALHANRERILAIPDLVRIVPGHGPAFAPTAETPR